MSLVYHRKITEAASILVNLNDLADYSFRKKNLSIQYNMHRI